MKMAKLVNIQTQGLPLKTLELGAIQLRKFFDEEKLNELASSLKEKGALQPILVRPLSEKDGKKYEVIMGARRLKAAQIAGFRDIPAYVIKKISDPEALEMALTENLQREDLTPFEEAWAILRLIKEHGYSEKDVCRRLNKSDSFVRKRLTLLRLPEPVQKYISDGKLALESVSHLAKLPSPEKQIEMAGEIVASTLSVEETKEMIVEEIKQIGRKKTKRVKVRSKEVTDTKVVLAIKRLEYLLEDLDLRKLSLSKRENIKVDLKRLKKQLERIIEEIEIMD